jgi:DNA-binding NarL/FixJ family response regulator
VTSSNWKGTTSSPLSTAWDALEKLSGAHVDLGHHGLHDAKDGWACSVEITAQRSALCRPAYMMFTATTNPELQSKAIAAGVSGFLIRPITVQELLETVEPASAVLQRACINVNDLHSSAGF